jgi:uncharacterized protein YcbX
MTKGSAVGTVAAVNRYPVKSMQGEALDEAVVSTSGLDGDRGWGVVNTESGQVVTAKRVGQLLDARARLTTAGVDVELPDGTRLGEPGPDADAALSAWLDVPVTLRAAGPTETIFTMTFNVDDEDADTFEWPTPPGSFLDLAPVHVLTTASLAAAAHAYPDGNWNVHRFRPSVLIDTNGDLDGFVENDWVGRSLALGDVVLDISMPTIRCTLPTKPQALHDIDRDLEIFKALAASNDQNLGAYANVRTAGTVRVGDDVLLVDP